MRDNRGKTDEQLAVFPGSVQLKSHLQYFYYLIFFPHFM